MSQDGRLEAYKRAIAAKNYSAAYDAPDVLSEDEDLAPPHPMLALSKAATNVSTTAVAHTDQAEAIEDPTSYPALPALQRRALQRRIMLGAESAPYLAIVASLSFDQYPSPEQVSLVPHFALSMASNQVQFLNASTLWGPASQAGVFNCLALTPAEPLDIDTFVTGWCHLLSWRHAEKLCADLRELLARAREENQQGPWVSTDSLSNFWQFLESSPRIAYPQLALTPDGNLYARWRIDGQRLFSTQFMPNGDVRFVAFKPNRRHKNRVVRTSGVTSADALIEELEMQGVASWVLEPDER